MNAIADRVDKIRANAADPSASVKHVLKALHVYGEISTSSIAQSASARTDAGYDKYDRYDRHDNYHDSPGGGL